MRKPVPLEGFELHPNVNKVCLAILFAFLFVMGGNVIGFNIPESLMNAVISLAVIAVLLSKAPSLSIWVKK